MVFMKIEFLGADREVTGSCHYVAFGETHFLVDCGMEQAKPDLILTDVKMPGMDGLDFAEKAHEIYPNAVIVILTGYDSFAYAQKAISIGVEEYLLKPVDYDELKAMAARIAGEIHARKEKQQEIRDLKKYFNRSVPQLRSKFAGNLLYGRIQGKGVVKEQAESLNLRPVMR